MLWEKVEKESRTRNSEKIERESREEVVREIGEKISAGKQGEKWEK